MLKSNVSWSTNKDSYTQGKEAAEKAVVDLSSIFIHISRL